MLTTNTIDTHSAFGIFTIVTVALVVPAARGHKYASFIDLLFITTNTTIATTN